MKIKRKSKKTDAKAVSVRWCIIVLHEIVGKVSQVS